MKSMDEFSNVVRLTRELLHFDTINPPGREEPCIRFLADRLASGGFDIATHEFRAGRPCLVATLRGGKGKPPLCFTGHVDTVALGEAAWIRDPFRGDIVDGKLYGRGSSDMKGGVAAFVIAALAMASLPGRTADIVLVITASEENGCEGAAFLASLRGALGRAGALVVAEPTANRLYVGHKGALWLELRARGVAAHGSMPDQGRNAIYPAAEAILKLRTHPLNYPADPLLGSATLNVGTFSGGTRINVVPDHAGARIDIRTVPGKRSADTVSEIRTLLGPEIAVDVLLDVAPVATDPRDPWVRDVGAVLHARCGKDDEPAGLPYFTDAGFLRAAMGFPPTVILGPGEPDLAHKVDEFCHVSRLVDAVDIYTDIARRWCGDSSSRS